MMFILVIHQLLIKLAQNSLISLIFSASLLQKNIFMVNIE